MNDIKKQTGFAVLVSTILLSIAAISFTTKMAGTQLIDNQVMANAYRSHEAFINAESGINMIMSQIDESTTILASLPLIYNPLNSDYMVEVERTNKNTVTINSLGKSKDGTAQRNIQLKIHHQVSYNTPQSALSSNGKLSLDSTVSINNGCEGLSATNCKSPGNIAKYQLISEPSNETQQTDLCANSVLGENQIDPAVFSSENNNLLTIGEKKEVLGEDGKSVIDVFGDTLTEVISWPDNQPPGSVFYGLSTDQRALPVSLFESTFGVTSTAGANALQASSEVITIDTSMSSLSCSKQLLNIDEDITTIYIKGDCKIELKDTFQSITAGGNHFSIGSSDHPKQVFIEGGSFDVAPNVDVLVVGMLYFLPKQQQTVDENGDEVSIEDNSVNMNGVRVDGALLSDYNCSFAGDDQLETSNATLNLSVRYDKSVLNKLYKDIGGFVIDSGYSIIEGSWRDF